MRRFTRRPSRISSTWLTIHTRRARSWRWKSQSCSIYNLTYNRPRLTASSSATPRLPRLTLQPSSCPSTYSNWPYLILKWTSTSLVCWPPQRSMSPCASSYMTQVGVVRARQASGRAILSKIQVTRTTISKTALKTTSNLPLWFRDQSYRPSWGSSHSPSLWRSPESWTSSRRSRRLRQLLKPLDKVNKWIQPMQATQEPTPRLIWAALTPLIVQMERSAAPALRPVKLPTFQIWIQLAEV